ncbi:diaminopimelate epimerase [Paenibacillus sp. GCM10027627]|uniref:diaminopimelate epimerase n=1 Tax=unclassified Paenibacillus TaxID=185978 RepID=UPI00362ED72E
MKKEVDFVKCSPANNMTILVKSVHPAEQHSLIAAQMMDYGHLYAEQVGFIEKPSTSGHAAKLQMAGGEFCGNACLALAACLASEKELEPGQSLELLLDVSGADEPVPCFVEKLERAYLCEAGMPMPKSIQKAIIPFEDMLLETGIVRYSGCFHLVIDCERYGLERAAAERLAKLLGVASGHDLVGIMLYRPSSSELAPLIYVPALHSLIWEQGCGSGTASLGCYLAWRERRSLNLHVHQPGGTIHLNVGWDGMDVTDVSIKTAVAIVAQGKAYVDELELEPFSIQGGVC